MLVFAHLPKTGGSSITALIIEYLKHFEVADSQIMRYGIAVPYSDLSPLDKLPGNVRFISGHLNPAHYKKIMPHRPFVLASYRKTLERIKSWFEHVYRDPDGFAHVYYPRKTDNVERYKSPLVPTWEFLAECKLAGTSCSLMSRAMERYKKLGGFSTFLAQNIQVYRNQNVANAQIAINQIEDFVEKLSSHSGKPTEILKSLKNCSKENIQPATYFKQFDERQEEVFDACFSTCFSEEILEEDRFCKNIPNIFEKNIWEAFSKILVTEANPKAEKKTSYKALKSFNICRFFKLEKYLCCNGRAGVR